ncbi:MAG: LysR family transcriptional regulator [Rhodobacteraceae bacterium]|jgi:DNA-binding transcriptional LysR family regulator|nr:LysR family transcriptional regulator [Paracoccaceae bacterium]
MTLEQIRIFLCVADLCHVTRASERLNLTQSAVSAAIAALERQHDVKLFDRVGRGIVLTDAGHHLREAGERLMREADNARDMLHTMSHEPRGNLRLWASQTIASYWLPPLLIAMHRAWPMVNMGLRAANTHEVTDAVSGGLADIGFVEGELPPSDLVRRTVGQDELLLVMPRSHVLARKPGFDAADYRAMSWLLREHGSGTAAVVERHLNAMGLSSQDLDVLLHLPTNEAILAGIRAGNCVSLLSWRSLAQGRPREFALRRITWAERPRRDFTALTDPRRYQSRAMAVFLRDFAPGRSRDEPGTGSRGGRSLGTGDGRGG